jgi:hypothetical protein
LVSNQKCQWEGLGMENVGIFYEFFLEYVMAIWYNEWPFGIVCGHLIYSPHFGMFGPRQIWQPCRCQVTNQCLKMPIVLIGYFLIFLGQYLDFSFSAHNAF